MPRSGGLVRSPEGSSESLAKPGVLVLAGIPASALQVWGWALVQRASSAVSCGIASMPPLPSYIRRRTAQPSRLISSAALRR